MSYTRIKSFTSWLANKWCVNLFRLPLTIHAKCISSTMDNAISHCISFGILITLGNIFVKKDSDGVYQNTIYWDIALYLLILHFVYCLIVIQYNRYIAEMNSTMDRLKEHE
jgi:hypothetical protein